MKKIVKFVIASLLGSLLAAPSMLAAWNGNTPGKTQLAEKSVRYQLEMALSDVANNGSGAVAVYFEISPKGKFELLKVDGEKQDLIKDVRSVLNNSPIKAPKYLAGKYRVDISFVDKDNVSTSSFTSASDVLREEISSVLSSVDTYKEGSVTVVFLVKDGNFELKKVEGDGQLASAVKTTLSSNAISVPAELSGYYQLDVRF
jgi:hypothetical protein